MENCAMCGREIDGVYETIGGSLFPWIAGRVYHWECVPRLRVKRKNIEEMLDEIVMTLPPMNGAGWVRKPDIESFEVFELRVPKRVS